MKKEILLFCLFFSIFTFSQNSKTVNVGILWDKQNEVSREILKQLYKEVQAVVGQSKKIVFNEVLENNLNVEKARQNYEKLLNDNTDIILAFGVYNNLALYKEKKYPKPIVIFGSFNSDLIKLPEGKKTTGIHNLTYLITPFSYRRDLDAFYNMYEYRNIGIVVNDFLIKTLPLKKIFNKYFDNKNSTYKIIPYKTGMKIEPYLSDVDAVYIADFLDLNDKQFREIVKTINRKKLPSFSIYSKDNVKKGILAGSQFEEDVDQFLRRTALNIEAIINGTNPADLSLFMDYKEQLAINFVTATQINFPLRFRMLSYADFIGDDSIKPDDAYSIVDVMKEVLNKNLSLRAERKNIEISEQEVKKARSSYYPDLSLSATGAYLDPEVAKISNGQNPEFSTSGKVVLEQLLFSESASANITIQKEMKKAKEASYNAAQLDALLNVSDAYFNALILESNVRIQNSNLLTTKKNLKIAKQNFDAGASGKSDILRFRSQLAQNIQNLVDAANSMDQAFNTLNQLMGRPIGSRIEIEEAIVSEGLFKDYEHGSFITLMDNPRIRPILVEFLLSEARKNAPELKNIDYNLEATKRNYKMNKLGRFLPTVAVQGQYNYSFSKWGEGSEIPAGVPQAPDGSYNVGVNLSLPLFQKNQWSINSQLAKVQEEQLEIQKSNTLLNLDKNINNIVLDLISQITNIKISKIAEETAKESLELTQNSYFEGAVSVIQLIDAQTNYLQAQLASSTANYKYLMASFRLERAVGHFFLLESEESNKKFLDRAKQHMINNKIIDKL